MPPLIFTRQITPGQTPFSAFSNKLYTKKPRWDALASSKFNEQKILKVHQTSSQDIQPEVNSSPLHREKLQEIISEKNNDTKSDAIIDINNLLPVPIDIMPKPGKIASIIGKDFRSKFTLRKCPLVLGNMKSIQYIPSNLSIAPNFTTPSPSLDVNDSPKVVSTDDNQSLSVIDSKLDENFDKDTDICNKGTSPDQDQTIIEELFLQIRDRTIYKRMTERVIVQTYEFFLHFPKQISMDDRIKPRSLSVWLRLFQAFGILSMFNIEIVTNSGDILADEMGFGKILILLLFSHLLIHYRQSNTLINLCVIGSC